MALVVCSQCRRHVKRGESVCPFCGAPQSAPGGLRRGLGAAVFLGAGLAVGGCGSGTDLGGGDAGVAADGSSADARDEQPAILYAPIPYDAGDAGDAGGAEDAGAVALYAAVPIYSSVPHVE